RGAGGGGSIRLVPSTNSGTAGSSGTAESMTASASPVPKPRPRPEPVEGNGRVAKPQGSPFENAFRNIDNILRKESGCTTELDYTEQTSWIIFLKYLHDLEATKEMAAELEGKPYTPLLARVGLPERRRWHDRSPQGPYRSRPRGLRGPDALPLPQRLQAARPWTQHHRVQDRRDLRRDHQQGEEQLQPARDPGGRDRPHSPRRNDRLHSNLIPAPRGTCQKYSDKKGEFRFRLKAGNGEIIL